MLSSFAAINHCSGQMVANASNTRICLGCFIFVGGGETNVPFLYFLIYDLAMPFSWEKIS